MNFGTKKDGSNYGSGGSELSMRTEELRNHNAQSKQSHWSLRDARLEQLKPAYIDEEVTQEASSGDEQSPKKTNKDITHTLEK